MRRALVLVALASLAAFTARAEDEGIAWRTDLARAREEARRDGKPLFVVFRCEP
jgi:hypothetical protein